MATISGLLPAAAHAAPAPAEMATKLLGKTIFLDPGHQGPNHGENLSRQVDNGRGGTKDCQTTGMVTVNGIPEHTINWNVAQLVKASLESLGAQVVLSRNDDSGWGGCVDDRARAANASGAAVAVSIHADSAPPTAHGFHLIVPQLPIPDPAVEQAQSAAGLTASKLVRDAYLHAGFPAANYAGVQEGLQTRADVAGPALATVPTVFLEMGNGANPEDASMLESEAGQLRHAVAITTGLASYLLGVPPGGTGSADSAPAAPVLTQPQRAPITAENVPQVVPEASPLPPVPGTPMSQGYAAAPGRLEDKSPTSPGIQNQGESQISPDALNQGQSQTSPGSQNQGQSQTSPSIQGQGGSQTSPDALNQGQSQSQTSPGIQNQGQGQTSPSIPGQSQSLPGTQNQGQSQTSPGTQNQGQSQQAAPGCPTTPGAAKVPGCPAPGTQGQNQKQTEPGTEQLDTSTLLNAGMQLLLPLIRSFGMDNSAITSELINLAYTLASTLLGPAK
ncbi:N-acetylmuramoyl-L-alanine amidase [Nocardia sp. XZ_19_385]|uniref:N-acetylmuramoyl-L-alanine amidase n=1 Tax=Nocardia sp. XZ_19_385 TaxID=2769488 RepID=UPI0035CCD24C